MTARDRVVVLDGVPCPTTGDPAPVVLASEQALDVVYVTAANAHSEATCRLSFEGAIAHTFGSPNDEALHGHPLFASGLTFYSAHEVVESSWIATLAQRNEVHSRHQPALFEALRHVIVTFHDSTFECVARDVTAVLHSEPVGEVVRALAASTR